jgi:hypothetical protein
VEIEISRRFIATIVLSLVILALAVVGLAVSPRDTGGHPLLLSPERRAVLHYLSRCRNWADRLESLQTRLDNLTPEGTDFQPATSPGDLYRQAQEAQRILDATTSLRREVEQARIPSTMTGVHGMVTASVQATYAWAEALSAFVGAPSQQGVQELVNLRREARESLTQLLSILTPEDKNGSE